VTFRWKDYAHGSKQRKMTLLGTEFLRRFFLHVLPKGFVRIRHFGFLSNPRRAFQLPLCRQLLAMDTPEQSEPSNPGDSPSTWHCPRCGAGMAVIQRLTAAEVSRCSYFDSS
jgi:rubredoxin